MSAVTFNERWAVVFKASVEAEIDNLQKVVARGALADHAAYKRETGKIAGLESALSLLEQSLKDIQET